MVNPAGAATTRSLLDLLLPARQAQPRATFLPDRQQTPAKDAGSMPHPPSKNETGRRLDTLA